MKQILNFEAVNIRALSLRQTFIGSIDKLIFLLFKWLYGGEGISSVINAMESLSWDQRVDFQSFYFHILGAS